MMSRRGVRCLGRILWLATAISISRGGDAEESPVVARFSDPTTNGPVAFRKLARDLDTGYIYVGGVNHLYQLDSGMQLLQKVRNGPETDSPYCNYDGQCILSPFHYESNTKHQRNRTVSKTLMDNFNQILVVYREKRVLIACGTVLQGICSVHRLDDISKTVFTDKMVPVAANMPNATTAAFVAPGPKNDSVLYVGATFTFDAYRDHFPAVCSRSLSDKNMFQLTFAGEIVSQSAMIIRNDVISDFKVQYIGGFYHDGFAYWAAVQRKSLDTGAPYVSKLLRVCGPDARYESYSEIPLECLSTDNSNYNLLQAFHVGRLGSRVLSTLSNGGSHGPDPSKPAKESAICVFSMNDIRSAFWYNIQRCNSGIGYRNLPHFGLNQPCQNVGYFSVSASRAVQRDFCHPIRVGGHIFATTVAAVSYTSTLLTSVVVDVIGEDTVLFAGTSAGNLKKVHIGRQMK
ncbi:unnamed protein product [Soboliphyme baturini]|uniref:Sema domain-containing protein n=1 Tax=Soboliphyme baturini TaxID=241478 RepID=A0A183IWZ1_9BILA|nr:unnamed protein product [Soboliphyme baturini]